MKVYKAMKIYSVIPNKEYSGEIMIIAANTTEEAKKIAVNDDFIVDEPKEIKKLAANVDKPGIIMRTFIF